MARLVIDPGNAPVSEESLEGLRSELQGVVGPDVDVVIGGYEGPRELREGAQVVPIIELFLEGVAAVAGVATAVLEWRKKGNAPPRKVTRIQAWELDEAGNPRLVWIEETEEEGD